jgi:hypothetical protein
MTAHHTPPHLDGDPWPPAQLVTAAARGHRLRNAVASRARASAAVHAGAGGPSAGSPAARPRCGDRHVRTQDVARRADQLRQSAWRAVAATPGRTRSADGHLDHISGSATALGMHCTMATSMALSALSYASKARQSRPSRVAPQAVGHQPRRSGHGHLGSDCRATDIIAKRSARRLAKRPAGHLAKRPPGHLAKRPAHRYLGCTVGPRRPHGRLARADTHTARNPAICQFDRAVVGSAAGRTVSLTLMADRGRSS